MANPFSESSLWGRQKPWLTTLFFCLITWPTQADEFDHSLWNQLLVENVSSDNGGRRTAVDYQGMANQRSQLTTYLTALGKVSQKQFDGWGQEQQLAFLINAYNAWTVELILTEWPKLDSIRDLGSWFRSPWSKKFIPLFGSTVTLDHIEHELIRGLGRYNNPLIHFAVNCASIGCPPLRQEAYVGDKLEAQLDEQTRLFLSNREQNRLSGDTLAISSIFKWYREDFEKGWHGYRRLEDFLLAYAKPMALSDAVVKHLLTGDQDIEYLDYDWRLNQR